MIRFLKHLFHTYRVKEAARAMSIHGQAISRARIHAKCDQLAKELGLSEGWRKGRAS